MTRRIHKGDEITRRYRRQLDLFGEASRPAIAGGLARELRRKRERSGKHSFFYQLMNGGE